MEEQGIITMTRPALQMLLTQAAHDGAKQALADVGLGDEYAVNDVREFRALMKTYRLAKKTAIKAIVQQLVNFIFLLLLIGFGAKYGVKMMGG